MADEEQQTVDQGCMENKVLESVKSNDDQLSSKDFQGEEHLQDDAHMNNLKDQLDHHVQSFSPRSIASTGRGSLERDEVLIKLNKDRTQSLIKAWEENMKAKSLHRYNKKVSRIFAWEKAQKAKSEANLRALEEKLEKKKAECIEKMKNQIAAVHMRAEEERALADAHHGEEILKAEELAAKYRASGKIPKRNPLCFACYNMVLVDP